MLARSLNRLPRLKQGAIRASSTNGRDTRASGYQRLIQAAATPQRRSTTPPTRQSLRARLTHNLPSQAGRVDYIPARLVQREGEQWVEPIFGKSNQIFTLVFAEGMVRIASDSNGASAGDVVEVRLF